VAWVGSQVDGPKSREAIYQGKNLPSEVVDDFFNFDRKEFRHWKLDAFRQIGPMGFDFSCEMVG